MVSRPVVVDSHQFDEEQVLDLQQIEISEPDPRQSEKADPEKRNRNTGFLCKKVGSGRIILDPDPTSSKAPHPRKFGSIKLLQHFIWHGAKNACTRVIINKKQKTTVSYF